MNSSVLYPDWRKKIIFGWLLVRSAKYHRDYLRVWSREKLKEIKQDPEAYAAMLDKQRKYNRSYYAKRMANDPSFAERNRIRGRGNRNKAKDAAYARNRRATDKCFRLAHVVRTRVGYLLRGRIKYSSCMDLLGCSVDQLRSHLESLFKPGMSWDNFGSGKDKWSMDHKVPCAAHDLSTEDGQRAAFHYTNLQPEWHSSNIKKSSIYNGKRWYYRDHIKQAK